MPRPTTSHGDLPPAVSSNTTPVSPGVDVAPLPANAGEPARAATAGVSTIPDTSPDTLSVNPTVNTPVERRNTTASDAPSAPATPTTIDSAANRELTDIRPSAPATVVTPHVETPNPSTEIASPQPLTTPLTPRQSFGATKGTEPNAPTPERASRRVKDESASQSIRKVNDTPARGSAETTRENSERPVASPAVSVPAGPVATPDFPAVSDDPFAPIAAPSPVPTNTDNHSDDPFAPLPTSPAVNEKPATSLVLEPTLKKLDMLTPGSDGRLPLREWTDNTGKFNVEAKLVLIQGGKVRLLKETGRTTTVAIERLSKADRDYVTEAIGRYGEDLAKLHQLASR